jgi:hypothetical protein
MYWLARTTIVSVDAEKSGGLSVQPTRSTKGKATRVPPSAVGKTTPSLRQSQPREVLHTIEWKNDPVPLRSEVHHYFLLEMTMIERRDEIGDYRRG